MRINNYKLLTLAAIVSFSASCTLSSKIDSKIDREHEDMEMLREAGEVPGVSIPDDVIRVKDDIWLGNTSDIEYEGEPLPQYLEDAEGITLISNRPITLYEIGDTITKITSLKVRYDPLLEGEAQSNAAGNQPTMDALGADWTDPSKMIVSYQGPLSGLLDEVSSRFGIWWKYERKELFFYKHITKTFVIYSLPTNSSLSVNVGGSSTEGGGAGSNSVNLSNSAQIEMWSKIETAIRSIISSDAQLTTDASNGTITLTATPNDIKKVSKFVNEQNARLSRQVAITVKVLQLALTDSDQYGLNWTAAFNGGKHLKSLGITSAAGLGADVTSGLSMNILSGDWTIDTAIQAISGQGKTNLITSGTITTLNNKPAPIQVVKTQNYISEITKTNSGSDNYYDISTETKEIETGFTLDILPRILEHGRLLIMFNMTLSDLLSLEKVNIGGSGEGKDNGSYIQNPVIESRGFSQEIAMKSGETLILSGYERTEDSVDKTGIGNPDNILLGGANTAKRGKTMIIILLTPVVLESPLDPETRIN